MAHTAKVLGYVAFSAMTLFGLLGAIFLVGEVFGDPGGWAAVGITAAWLIPLAGLSAFAALRPASAAAVLTVITMTAAGFTLADSSYGIVPRDDWGPVAAVVVFAVGVALGFLGLHRALLAGTLMVFLSVAQFAATQLARIVAAGGGEAGPVFAPASSSGVVIVPILVVGGLFVLAGVLDRRPVAHLGDRSRGGS